MTVKRLLLYLSGVLALLIVAVLLMPGRKEAAAQATTEARRDTAVVVTTINGERVIAPEATKKTPSRALNTLPPEDIGLSEISYVTQEASRPVLVLRDDSRLAVTSYVLERLPSEVQTRVSYSRER